MTEEQGEGEGNASADENVAQRIAHHLFPRCLAKLIKEGVLVRRGGCFAPLPLAHRYWMNPGQLRKLDLIKAEFFPQVLNLR